MSPLLLGWFLFNGCFVLLPTLGARGGKQLVVSLVTQQEGLDPQSGEYYLFVSRNRKSAKVLLWDGTGLCIYQKRLCKRRFACLWSHETGEAIRMTSTELALFLEGSTLVGRVKVSPDEVHF